MSSNDQLKLIKELHQLNIINQDELQQAELYLSLSSFSFNSYQDVLAWFSQNHIFNKERENSAYLALQQYQHQQAADIPTQPEIAENNIIEIGTEVASEPLAQQEMVESHFVEMDTEVETGTSTERETVENDISEADVRVDIVEPTEHEIAEDNIVAIDTKVAIEASFTEVHSITNETEANSITNTITTAVSLDDIYQYNLIQVEKLREDDDDEEYPLSLCAEAAEKLKNCPYTFCDIGNLMFWVDNKFVDSFDFTQSENIISTHNALLLFNMVQQNVIYHEEYESCYLFLLRSQDAQKQPSYSEENLRQELIKEGCFDHQLVNLNLIKNHNHNRKLLDELVHLDHRKYLYKYYDICRDLEKIASLRFTDALQLAQWIETEELRQSHLRKLEEEKAKTLEQEAAFKIVKALDETEQENNESIRQHQNLSISNIVWLVLFVAAFYIAIGAILS